MSQADAPAADWYPDPSGRFQFRYWDGAAWTGHVSTDGKTDWDPPADGDGGQEAAAEQTAASTESEAVQEAVQQEEAAAQAQATEPVGDSTWAPQAAAEPEAAAQPEPEAAQEPEPAAETSAAAEGGTIEEGEPSDTNLVANQRAALEADVKGWVDEVASQVEPRLSRINTDWTMQPQAEAARACAYGLLIGHLAHLHPHMRGELSQVAEAHPSFTTLDAGARLDTLEQIAGDPQRTAAWLGPLIGSEDVQRVQMLFD